MNDSAETAASNDYAVVDAAAATEIDAVVEKDFSAVLDILLVQVLHT